MDKITTSEVRFGGHFIVARHGSHFLTPEWVSRVHALGSCGWCWQVPMPIEYGPLYLPINYNSRAHMYKYADGLNILSTEYLPKPTGFKPGCL